MTNAAFVFNFVLSRAPCWAGLHDAGFARLFLRSFPDLCCDEYRVFGMSRSRYRSTGWWMWQIRRPLKWLGGCWKACIKACVESYRRRFPKRVTDDELYARLQKDVASVQKHITDAFRYRKMFVDTTEMLQAHPILRESTDAGYWYEWLRTIYAHYIVMAVRRELDRGADAPNMYRLLREVQKRPQVLSRARYKAFWDDSPIVREHHVNLWDEPFNEMAGTGGYIDPAIVKNDLEELDRQAKLVIQYANRIVAHRTPDTVPTTLRDVNASLESIERMLKKYYVLLTGKSLMAAEPSILVPWQRAFREPWIVRGR